MKQKIQKKELKKIRHTGPVKKRPNSKTVSKKLPLHKLFLLNPISIFLLLCVGVLITGLTVKVIAVGYTVTATVPAPPLLTPAIISSPLNDANVKGSPITVEGSCPPNSYVKLMRNGYFSGSSVCDSNNKFSILTDLSIGQNLIQANDFNLTDDPGPTRPLVTINYLPPLNTTTQSAQGGLTVEAANSPSGFYNYPSDNAGYGPLQMGSSYNYQTFKAQQNFHWEFELKGGTPPYVVTVQWGDGTTSSLVFKTDPVFNVEHVYQKPGNYHVVLTAVDAAGEKVVMQISAAIQPFIPSNTFGGVLTPTTKPSSSAKGITQMFAMIEKWLWLIWPSYIIIILMAFSFWLGEKQEDWQLLKRHRHKKLTHFVHKA